MHASTSSRLALVLLSLALLTATGCQRGAQENKARATATASPRQRLADLTKRYQQAKTYQDAGELRFLVEGAPEDEFRTLPFSVALERPNKLRLHLLDTTTVADGQLLRGMVQSLADQVLVRPCPEQLTVRALQSDEMLSKAMRGQLAVRPPQLELLLGDDPVGELASDSSVTQLADSEFQGRKCHRLAMTGPEGRAVMWLDAADGTLVKFEFPLEEIRKQFPLVALWAEFRGARLDGEISPVAFQTELPEGVKQVNKLVMPPPAAPPALMGKPVEAFTFIDLDGSAIGRESLAGKVVVIDLWATWCGWCFEGLPLLERVYQQYKDNDKVAFLAVSKDDLSVSNASVQEAFEKNKLSIPIVRDQQQITDKLFQLEGLPTTIVLGTDGTIQDYHVGYDASLATTLPAKLQRLLAGENLAQQQQAEYEQARQEYEQRLAEVLVDPSSLPAQPEVARSPSTTK